MSEFGDSNHAEICDFLDRYREQQAEKRKQLEKER